MKHLILISAFMPFLLSCEGYKLTGHVPELATQERADEQIDIDKGSSDESSTCTLKEQNQGICRN